MADGQGCRCAARSVGECCCDEIDWTPAELAEARTKLEQLSAQIARARDILQKAPASPAVQAALAALAT